MSEPHRPATLLVARHGDAEYVETWFSDEGGWLSPAGREQAAALADAVRGRRVARVWSSDVSRAVQTAEIVAARLGLPGLSAGSSAVVTRKTLREVDAGDLVGQPFDVTRLHAVTDRWFGGDLGARFAGGESGAEVVSRYAGALGEIADQHRGETVVVVVHQTAASIALPVLTDTPDLLLGREHQLANGDYAEVSVDHDATTLVRWRSGTAD